MTLANRTAGEPRYQASGEPISPADLGGIDALAPCGPASNGINSVEMRWDSANGVLRAYETAAAAEGPLPEVDSTESLAGYVLRVVAIGRW